MNPQRQARRIAGSSAAAGALPLPAAASQFRSPFRVRAALNWMIRLLSSVRLAMALILVLAMTVLAGTLIDQAPPTVVANPEAYQRWLDNAHGTYGGATGLLDRFQLFNVFHSMFFRGLMTLLAASILLCTAKRWRPTWNTAFHTRSRMSESFLSHARFNAHIEAPMPPAEAAERIRRSLAHAHYYGDMGALRDVTQSIGNVTGYGHRVGYQLGVHLTEQLFLAGRRRPHPIGIGRDERFREDHQARP